MISGATAVAPKSSSISSKLLQEAAEFVAALNSTHAAAVTVAGASVQFRFVMEFITNRECPQVDVSAIPEGILLVSRDNWEEAMGPVFGTRNLKHHADVQQVAMEQQQKLQASGGFLFPPPRLSTGNFKEATCACVGDCASAAAACVCMLGNKSCNSSYLPPHGTLSAPSHSQCKNPLNAAFPVSAPLLQSRRGQPACRCATGCASAACGCRGKQACTTACHGFSGHENCTNRTTPASIATAAKTKAKKKKASAAPGGARKKKAKGAAAAAAAAASATAANDDDEEEEEEDEDD